MSDKGNVESVIIPVIKDNIKKRGKMHSFFPLDGSISTIY